MKISKKAAISIRGFVRMTVPWIFARFTLDDKIYLHYFFFTKTIEFSDIKKVRCFDNILEIILKNASYQVTLHEAPKIAEYLGDKI